MTAPRVAWKRFSRREDEWMTTFREFVLREGESLYQQAAFGALHAQQIQQDPLCWGWPAWPKTFQDIDSPEVKTFCIEYGDDVSLYLWLQWLTWGQFAACWEISQRDGMPIDLYRDLAVGVTEDGSEAQRGRELYCLKTSVGVPPDILGPLGQNWGLPSTDSHIVTVRAYEPFIDLLRTNMQNCDALCIDHTTSMLRLWWTPYGETAGHGAYIQYPVGNLLSLLALESRRHRCMVIGEDLGTVPVETVSKLRNNGVYSYKMLYSESGAEKTFHAPVLYPEQPMAMATTHDLPILCDYWEGGDLTLDKALGLYPDEAVLYGLYQDCELVKQGPPDVLHRYGCLLKHAGCKASLMSMTGILDRGIQRHIAGSNSVLLGLQPEDWLEVVLLVNISGTSTEYPNWRRKLFVTPEQMSTNKQINKLIKGLDKRRKAANRKAATR